MADEPGVPTPVMLLGEGWPTPNGRRLMRWSPPAMLARCPTLPYGWVVEFGLVFLLLGQRGEIDLLLHVARALARGRSKEAQALLAACDRAARDFSDDHTLARAIVEGGARAVIHGLIGVVFWYLLLGLPGLLPIVWPRQSMGW